MEIIKKLSMVMVVLVCLGVGTAMAQVSSPSSTQQQGDRVTITRQDLPMAAQHVLDSSAYKGWTISNFYRTNTKSMDASGTTKQGYEVVLKKDANSPAQTLRFDENGKLRKDDDQDDQD
jgi:hypothetical protein